MSLLITLIEIHWILITVRFVRYRYYYYYYCVKSERYLVLSEYFKCRRYPSTRLLVFVRRTGGFKSYISVGHLMRKGSGIVIFIWNYKHEHAITLKEMCRRAIMNNATYLKKMINGFHIDLTYVIKFNYLSIKRKNYNKHVRIIL